MSTEIIPRRQAELLLAARMQTPQINKRKLQNLEITRCNGALR